jgi:hypothetical protein
MCCRLEYPSLSDSVINLNELSNLSDLYSSKSSFRYCFYCIIGFIFKFFYATNLLKQFFLLVYYTASEYIGKLLIVSRVISVSKNGKYIFLLILILGKNFPNAFLMYFDSSKFHISLAKSKSGFAQK